MEHIVSSESSICVASSISPADCIGVVLSSLWFPKKHAPITYLALETTPKKHAKKPQKIRLATALRAVAIQKSCVVVVATFSVARYPAGAVVLLHHVSAMEAMRNKILVLVLHCTFITPPVY
jgi:hypothetical protein